MNTKPKLNHLLRLVMPIVLGVSMMPFALAPAPASAAVTGSMWVDAINGSDSNPGTEAAPFKTITHALASASATETIVVEPGTYDTTNGEVFPLDDYGASLIAAAGPELTIIQGDGTHGLLVGRYFAEGDVISGLTFAGGGVDAGAGICVYVESDTGPSSPLIEGNVFDGNNSSYFGGGLAVFATGTDSAQPLIQNNTFRNNTADQGGAAAVVGNVSATFLGNTFEGNSAYIAGALQVLNTDTTVVIEGNEFVGNEASALAGAVHMGSVGEGTQSVSDNTFTSNHAAYDGGALFLATGIIDVDGNEANANSAVGFGGFARIGAAEVEACNNGITGSQGGEGGAAWHVTSGTLDERNDTVIDSVDSPSATTGEPMATIEVANSIYWNTDIEVDVQQADSLSYSCVSDALVADASRGNVVGAEVIDADPTFVEPDTPDVTLAPESPCIDTAATEFAPDVDMFGTTRPQDGDGDGTALPDIGCFECAPEGALALAVEAQVPIESDVTLEPEPVPVLIEPIEPTVKPSKAVPSSNATSAISRRK